MKLTQLAAILSVCVVASGCGTLLAPIYTTNYAGVNVLKTANLMHVNVGEVVAAPNAKNKVEFLTIRGGKYSSPYGSFAAYVKEALKDDLDHADLLDPHSMVVIDGALIRNELDASGLSVAFAEMEAKLTISRDGRVLYDQTKSAREEWRSNALGAIAVSRARQSYPSVIRQLLGKFYADPEFMAALKAR